MRLETNIRIIDLHIVLIFSASRFLLILNYGLACTMIVSQLDCEERFVESRDKCSV